MATGSAFDERGSGVTGFGKFRIDLSRLLTEEKMQLLATYFEFHPADIDGINKGPHPGIAFIHHMETKDILKEDNITPLIDALKDIGFPRDADEVRRSFDRHVNTPTAVVNHAQYPYLTKQEFIDSANNLDKLASLNERGKRECESRCESYSLQSSQSSEPADRIYGVQHLRVMMVGETGSGKSATANSLLGKTKFEESDAAESETASCGIATSKIGDRFLSVVDSPGFDDASTDGESDGNIKKELRRVAYLLRDGVHAFIFVWNADRVRFSNNARRTIRALKEEFGENIFHYCFVVYSHARGKLDGGTLLDTFVERQRRHRELKNLLDEIGWRIVAVDNNTDIPAEQRRNQTALVDMIDKTASFNKGEVYTNELFQKVKELHQRVEQGSRDHYPALVAAVVECYDSEPTDVHGPPTINNVMDILEKNKTGELQNSGSEVKLVDDQGEIKVILRDECKDKIESIHGDLKSTESSGHIPILGVLGSFVTIAFTVWRLKKFISG